MFHEKKKLHGFVKKIFKGGITWDIAGFGLCKKCRTFMAKKNNRKKISNSLRIK
jgi:hypothetical protein